jgi:hypothetical protein
LAEIGIYKISRLPGNKQEARDHQEVLDHYIYPRALLEVVVALWRRGGSFGRRGGFWEAWAPLNIIAFDLPLFQQTGRCNI